MHRLALLVAVTAAVPACTTDDGPATDTGQLVRVKDQLFADCKEGAGTTCTIDVTFAEGVVTAQGRFENGELGPTATATLTDSARAHITSLVAQLPLTSPDTVHDQGCGGAPLRTTDADLVFDHDGARSFTIEYAVQGPMADFSHYVQDIVTSIRTCTAGELTFSSCDPNVF